MKIAIIGGGICGLATALYLHREGLDCTVYEAVPEIKPLGVGINILPHAIRRLYDLGVGEACARKGIEPKEFVFYTQNGQLIHTEPCGRHAGYKFPHLSMHRADLHEVLYDAVRERLGHGAVVLGHRVRHLEQDDKGVTIHFEDAGGKAVPSVAADVVIGADGLHSAVRRQFYPNEGPPVFGGIMMWRGLIRHKPILSGASIVRAGSIKTGKLVLYSIRNHDDGTQLFNWAVEMRRELSPIKPGSKLTDWHPASKEPFIDRFATWQFDWLNVPEMMNSTEPVFEHPMVDRDPIPRWTFGRITLAGDAAHPMYPRGGNGGAQAIIDAGVIAPLLKKLPPLEALKVFEAERLEKTSKIVVTNRSTPPDVIIERVEELSGGKRYERLEDVIPASELLEILERYKLLTSADIKTVNA
jgi:2-polyprenyl-6-methoxyphenol hydroxylase-like FAD-dependent oxidoreductase